MAAQFGRRLRRGATTTAVAAAAVAALSASQAPGITHATAGGDGQTPGQGAADTTLPPDDSATGNSPYYTDLPSLNTPNKPGASIDLPATGPSESGIPATVLAAYKQAEQTIAGSDPACRVPWQLLAAIGKVESGQARGGKVDAAGTTFSPIRGPQLNGAGFANITDTDNGAYDGDTTHDRAVGPMQFIPSTWATWGQDANGDGLKNPNNIFDAALAAGRYLCAGDRDLTSRADLDRAILSYNQSREYLNTVLSWFEFYKRGTHEVPDGTGTLPESTVPDSGPGVGSGSPIDTPPTVPTPPATTPPAKPKPPTKPTPKPPVKPTPPPVKPPVPPLPVTRIENAGTGELTAMAGRDFAEQVVVRVKNSAGRPVAQQIVRFEIIGDTEAEFTGGGTISHLRTAANGTAGSPFLLAGEKIGSFTVRATVVGRSLPPVDFDATVTARAADELFRVGEKPLKAIAGEKFETSVKVKATYQDTIAAGVAVTATMIKRVDGETVENDKGPHFRNAEGKTVRTLTGLTTDADGVLKLPKIYAEDRPGTYRLRLTAEGGATLTIELTVVAPSASPSASPSSTPSTSPSPSKSSTD
ncbi:lytic transglycosylase domain-containing protein [Streptomyces sp. NPDC020965]|uniref:lytic transglycosylase domain-containing protein n=1 Tax=Streptomyces sp. NPDC020965 TaxID=3365105 RepID=UPI003787F3C7